jgi:hypothetical protein
MIDWIKKKFSAFWEKFVKFLNPYFLLFYIFLYILYHNRVAIINFIGHITNMQDPTIGLH